MIGLTSRLTCRVDVYDRVEAYNDRGELLPVHRKIKSVWAEITPQTGRLDNMEGLMERADINYKFVVREGAIPHIKNSMYLIYKGQRYDIRYYNPNYKYKDNVEIFCTLVVES